MQDSTTRIGGVDWATDAHAVCAVDADGAAVAQFNLTTLPKASASCAGG
jgi:hypothetical protein